LIKNLELLNCLRIKLNMNSVEFYLLNNFKLKYYLYGFSLLKLTLPISKLLKVFNYKEFWSKPFLKKNTFFVRNKNINLSLNSMVYFPININLKIVTLTFNFTYCLYVPVYYKNLVEMCKILSGNFFKYCIRLNNLQSIVYYTFTKPIFIKKQKKNSLKRKTIIYLL